MGGLACERVRADNAIRRPGFIIVTWEEVVGSVSLPSAFISATVSHLSHTHKANVFYSRSASDYAEDGIVSQLIDLDLTGNCHKT